MKFRNFHQGCCGYTPTEQWSHVLALPDGSTAYGDTAGEVLEELIEGYAGLATDAARADARHRHALSVVDAAQEAAIRSATRSGRFDAADPDSAGLLTVLRAPKDAGILLELPDRPGEQASWDGAVPLVLVTTHYAPHGTYPPITGNTAWLDTTGDAVYLRSLDALGVVNYWSALDSAAS